MKLSFEDWKAAHPQGTWQHDDDYLQSAWDAATEAALAQQAQAFHCIECEGDASPLPHVCNPQQAQPLTDEMLRLRAEEKLQKYRERHSPEIAAMMAAFYLDGATWARDKATETRIMRGL